MTSNLLLFFLQHDRFSSLSWGGGIGRFVLLLLLGLVVVGGANPVRNSSNSSNNNRRIPSVRIGYDVNGEEVNMPLVGAGTWQYNDTIAYQSVCSAFEAGYTFVDTALGYGNQRGVGRAIRDCWTRSREELFVMTKIPGGLLTSEQVWAAHQTNLWELQLDYVDHLMTHFPSDWEETHTGKGQRQEEWLALEAIYETGEARSIGISHYCPRHIDDILEVASVIPSINQVEYHIGSQDVDHVMAKCQETGITFMSFSPLCGPCVYEPQDSLIHGDLVTELANKYQVLGSQIALRYIVQQALERQRKQEQQEERDSFRMGGVIPKSNNPKHIRSNIDLFHFEISPEDMERLHGTTKPAAFGGDCDVP